MGRSSRLDRRVPAGALAGLLALAMLAPGRAAMAQAPRQRPAQAGTAQSPVVAMTLADAVLIGLRGNRAIRSEYLRRIADRFALYVAEEAFTPKVNLAAAYIRSRSAGVTTGNLNAAPQVSWTLPTGASLSGGLTSAQNNSPGQVGSAYSQLSFQVIQPLLRGAGTDVGLAPLRISRILEQVNKLTLAQSVIDTITSIITAYRSLIESEQQQRIAENGLKRARQLLETNQVLIAAGRLAAVELVQSQASIAEGELQLASARNGADAARLQLLTLLALDPSSRIVTTDKLIAVPVRIDEAKALAIAYEHQPGYLAQLLTIQTGRINLDLARNQRLWDLSLIAGGGQAAAGTGLYQSLSGLRGNRTDYTAGVQLSVPIFDPSRRQAEVNATVALRQAELQSEQVRQQTGQQVRNAVRTVTIQGGQLQTAKRARELSALQLEIELTKLQAGRSSNFTVVSFQNTLQAAETAELSAIIAYLNALTTLDQVLGTTLETWQINLNDQ